MYNKGPQSQGSAKLEDEHSGGQKVADGIREETKTPQLGLRKTLEGAGLQAKPQDSCPRLDRAGPAKWADEHSDGQEAAGAHNGVEIETEVRIAR